MDSNKETFLGRWSRLKRTATAEAVEQAVRPAVRGASTATGELPPLESLDFSSDFSAFLQPKVEEHLKRAALKKLFQSPHFNQMDGLDVYIDDYNRFEPIPEQMLQQLNQARGLLFPDQEKQAGEAGEATRTATKPGAAALTAGPEAPSQESGDCAAVEPPNEKS